MVMSPKYREPLKEYKSEERNLRKSLLNDNSGVHYTKEGLLLYYTTMMAKHEQAIKAFNDESRVFEIQNYGLLA